MNNKPPWQRATVIKKIQQPRTLPLRFNSGTSKRAAIMDLMALLNEEPQVWTLLDRREG